MHQQNPYAYCTEKHLPFYQVLPFVDIFKIFLQFFKFNGDVIVRPSDQNCYFKIRF